MYVFPLTVKSLPYRPIFFFGIRPLFLPLKILDLPLFTDLTFCVTRGKLRILFPFHAYGHSNLTFDPSLLSPEISNTIP